MGPVPGPGEAERIRREPPPFFRATVVRVARVTPRLVRVSLTGPELPRLGAAQPAASVRVLFVSALGGLGGDAPGWTGNEFPLPDGSRPAIRTLTPIGRTEPSEDLGLEIVTHGKGVASSWAATAAPGDVVAVSGTGRG